MLVRCCGGRACGEKYVFLAEILVQILRFHKNILGLLRGGCLNARNVVHFRDNQAVFVVVRLVNDKAVKAELLEREGSVLCFRGIEQLLDFRFNALLLALQVLDARFIAVAVRVKLVQARRDFRKLAFEELFSVLNRHLNFLELLVAHHDSRVIARTAAPDEFLPVVL